MNRRAILLLIGAIPLAPARSSAQTIEECLELARRNAPALQVSDAGVSRAEQAIRQARAALAPTLKLDASYQQASEDPKTVIPFPGVPAVAIRTGSATSVDVRTRAQMTVYSGGRDPALVRAAEAAKAGQVHSREQAEADLVLRVSRAFYRTLAARGLDLAAREAVDSAQTHLRTSAARVRAGVAPRVDSLQASVNLSQRHTALLRAEEAVRLARVELETAIGVALDPSRELIGPGPPDPTLPDSVTSLAAALRARPELAALDESLRETDQRIRAARAGRRPEVNVNATAEYRGPNLNGDYFDFDHPGLKTYNLSAGLGLTVPILDGGLTSARVGQLEADRLATEARRRDQTLVVRREVEQALSDLRIAFSIWQSASQRVVAAREALRLADAGYKGGTSQANEVRDAEASLADAQAEEAQSLSDYWSGRAALDHAIGATPSRKGD